MERRRLKVVTNIPFEGKVKSWGMSYLYHNWWRIRVMCDFEDLVQEAYFIYWRIVVQHPEISTLEDFLRVYKVALRFRVTKHAMACVPNPYNMVAGGPVVSLTSIDGSDQCERLLVGGGFCLAGDVDRYLDVSERLPVNLREVFLSIARDILGVRAIPRRSRRRLRADGWSTETLSSAINHKFGLDLLADDCPLYMEVARAASL